MTLAVTTMTRKKKDQTLKQKKKDLDLPILVAQFVWARLKTCLTLILVFTNFVLRVYWNGLR